MKFPVVAIVFGGGHTQKRKKVKNTDFKVHPLKETTRVWQK